MISLRIFSLSWLATIPLLLSVVNSAALTIPLTNQGFEAPAVAEGIYTQAPTGWSVYNGSVLGTDVYAYNPNFSDDFPAEAPEGLNIVGVYGVLSSGAEKGISQTLSSNFKEGGTYQLSFKVGYTNTYGAITGYRVQLLAGNTVIVEDDNSLNPAAGVFAPKTIQYVYNPILHSGLVGQPLQIRLLNKNLTDAQNEVAFDDVQLTVVLDNPYADAGGPYSMTNPVSSLLSLNASASLPSGNATITEYAWDLDNNGTFDVIGVTPTAISYSDLQTIYNMKDGINTIRLRVTDSSAKATIALGLVQLVTSTKYIGPNTGNVDTWSNVANWDNGLPQGVLDVVVQTRMTATPWSNATPNFTGNLTLQSNAQLVIGWTAQLLGSYNAFGTPGISKISMNTGSVIMTRMGGTPIIPEVQLLGNSTFILGTSSQGGSQAQFNYPITGAYQITFQGNGQGSCIANLNTANGFSSLLASGSEGGVTIIANAAGSLGTGDVTIAQRTGNAACYGILEINAANAMADTGTLRFTGTATTRLRMNANDTIAALIIDGVTQPAGTYGSSTSGATNQRAWITGTGVLTVATPTVNYWDINGTTAGAGGTNPAGTWNTSNTWNATAAGTGSVAAWVAGRTPIFSAGSDATGAYAVSVVGTQNIGGLVIRSGSLSLNQGSGGALNLTSNSNITVDSGSSSIATPINESSARILSKSGAGSLTLSGALSHTGGTNLSSGNLTLSGGNNLATGATTVTSGVLRVDSASAIPGTTRNATINSTGTLVFGPSFDSTTINSALTGRVVTGSAGTIAADNNASDDFNFSTAGLTAAYFGARSNVNYTGTLTPQGSTYRLSSYGGTLTMANTNALTSARSLTARGAVVLAGNNDYTGATNVETNSLLSLLGSTSTSGITLNAGTVLTVGNNGSLGTGTLTLAGLTTLKAVGTVVTTNAVAANSDFSIAGIGALTLGTTTINSNRTITNIGSGTTTFGSIVNGAANLSLTVEGSGNTTVSGNLTLVNGNLTKNGGGTLTLNGANTYFITSINGGVLRLNGSVSGAGTTNIGAAVLQLGSNSNGGLPIGNITIGHPSAFIQALSADRSISNNIILDNHVTFSGSNSLTINGKLTNNNADRTVNNNIISTKTFILGNVDLSQNTTNRILTIAGPGNTVVNGVIANGGGSSASALIKSGSGKLTFNGANTYTGATTLSANGGELYINGSMGASNMTINDGSNLFINGSTISGSITMNGNSNLYINGTTGGGNITMNGTSKLFINNTTGSGTVTINSGSTLLGTGIIGGNTTIAANGKLEFVISSIPANHDKLELAPGRALTFSSSSQVTVSGVAEIGTYTLLTAPNGITGSIPDLVCPSAWVASLSIVGNDLRLTVDFTGDFLDPPTLTSITDNKSGGPVDIYTPITYTVTFSRDMNDTTVSSSDFTNAGSSSIVFDSITETASGVFTIQVTPTSTGTLQLRINQGANLRSADGLSLNTSSAILDDTTLTIAKPTNGVLAVTSGDFISESNPGGSFSPVSKTYTLTNYGNQALNWTAAKTAAWIDLSGPSGTSGTLASGASTTVTVTANAAANSLAIGSYFDTVTFTNTTLGLGNTTRGVSFTMNGLPVEVTLGNLNQTYDGTPKAVSVTTNPVKTYSLTYNGLAELPTTAGSYDIVATVTESGYTGSATGTLVISKLSQTINFETLVPVGNDQSSITLTANSTSNLPVTFTSSNSAVATVVGNTVTITGVGTTSITANQEGNENYAAAASVVQDLIVTRANPLAVTGGPYTVSSTTDLVLNGSGSLPSNSQSITTYEWDLDSRNDGGGFTANATGATPAAITMAFLQSTYGMVFGTNTIRLRVTDSANKTSIVSTTVLVTAPLRWDADAIYSNGQTDGSNGVAGWLSTSQWRDVAILANTTWTSGRDAIFGNGGAGGAVLLPAPTSVGSITFNNFTGTYDLGDAFALTINRGVTHNSTGNAILSCPIILGADQTWTNTAGTLSIPEQLDLGAYTLTINNTAQFNLSGQGVGVSAIGTGGIIKNGTGLLRFGNSSDHQYTGPTVVNAGRLMLGVSIYPPGNVTLNGGILQSYWAFGVTRPLGSDAGQIQLTGGTTGFSASVSQGASVTLNNSANFEVVWGSQFFSPSTFVLENGAGNFDMTFNNRLDLNGATRTVNATTSGSPTGTSTFTGVIRNSSATPAGLIKTGDGILRLNAANTYNGGTTLQQGTLQLGNVSGLGSNVGTLTVNAGILNLNNIAAVTVGNLTGMGGTIGNNGAGALTLTIGNGGGSGGNFQGVIANNTNLGAGTLALTKTGTGSITLSGTNTYTGATNINQGKLFINGNNGASNIAVANGATLGGNGTLGGNATIAAGGKLEFRLSTPTGSHNPLDFTTGKGLTFSGASELTITLSAGVTTGTYVLVTGGNNIAGVKPATLNLPLGCAATVEIFNNNQLRLVVTAIGDVTPPTLTNIADNQAGDSTILIDTLVTYTVSFNEDIDATTVTSADFTNAGTAAITFGTITETTPSVFTVQVTPTTTGTLQLRIPTSAVIQDMSGNALVNSPAINDNWTTTVTSVPYTAWSNAGSFNTDTNGDGIPNGLAWLLGAANPTSNATSALPTSAQNSGNLTLSFRTLPQAGRGTALIKVQYSKDLGVTDLWASHEAIVPGSAGTSTVDGVTFVISNVAGGFIDVQATIPASAAAPGTKLFTRLSAVLPP